MKEFIKFAILHSFKKNGSIFSSLEELGDAVLDEEIVEVMRPLMGSSWVDLDCKVWKQYNWSLVFIPSSLFQSFIPSMMNCSLGSPKDYDNVIQDFVSIVAGAELADSSEVYKKFIGMTLDQILCVVLWGSYMKDEGLIGECLYQDFVSAIHSISNHVPFGSVLVD